MTLREYDSCTVPKWIPHWPAPDFRSWRYPSYAVDIDCMLNRFPDVSIQVPVLPTPCPGWLLSNLTVVTQPSHRFTGARNGSVSMFVLALTELWFSASSQPNVCILAVKITLRDVNSWRSVWPDACVRHGLFKAQRLTTKRYGAVAYL